MNENKSLLEQARIIAATLSNPDIDPPKAYAEIRKFFTPDNAQFLSVKELIAFLNEELKRSTDLYIDTYIDGSSILWRRDKGVDKDCYLPFIGPQAAR